MGIFVNGFYWRWWRKWRTSGSIPDCYASTTSALATKERERALTKVDDDDDSLCLSIKQFSRETQFLLLSCRDFCFTLSFIFYGIGIGARGGHLLRKSLFSSFPSVSAFYLFVCRPNTGRVLASPSRSHFSFSLSCRLSQSGDKNLPKYLRLLLPLLPEFLCGPWTANCSRCCCCWSDGRFGLISPFIPFALLLKFEPRVFALQQQHLFGLFMTQSVGVEILIQKGQTYYYLKKRMQRLSLAKPKK